MYTPFCEKHKVTNPHHSIRLTSPPAEQCCIQVLTPVGGPDQHTAPAAALATTAVTASAAAAAAVLRRPECVVKAVNLPEQDPQQPPAGLVHVRPVPAGGETVKLIKEDDAASQSLTLLEQLQQW